MTKRNTQSWEDFKKPRKTKRLEDWKEDGSVVVFVHTASGLTPRLFHLVPYADKDDKGKPTIRYYPFICHEDIDSYFARESPKHCPICKSLEWAANTKNKNDSDVMWEAVVGDPKKDRISTRLDYCGLEGGDWKQSFKPRLQYVFVVVDAGADTPALQVAIEPSSIHDGIKKVVSGLIDKDGENGDPSINPYPFRFKYNPKAKKAVDYYEVMEWSGKVEVTDEILAVLKSNAVDISYYIDPTPTDKLYDIMKAHFKGKKDIEKFFDNVLVDSRTEFSPEDLEAEDSESKLSATVKKVEDDEEDEEETKEEDEEEVEEAEEKTSTEAPCETCAGTGKVGKKKSACPDCDGTGYVAVEEEEAEEAEEEEEAEELVCETCEGTGVVGKKKSKCPDCGGTGKVQSEEAEEPEEPEEEEKPPAKPAKNPDKKPAKEDVVKSSAKPEEMSQCYNCKKMVPDSAKKCPHCGEEFADDEDD